MRPILFLSFLIISMLMVGMVSAYDESKFSGNTFYVSPSGNNANSGLTLQDAWSTVVYASANVPNNSTIWIDDGVYEGEIYHTNTRASFVAFRAINNRQAEIKNNGTGVFRFGTHNSAGNLDGFWIDGLVVNNTYQGPNYDNGYGIYATYGARTGHIRVTDCTIITGWGSAIAGGLNSGSGWYIDSNLIYNGAARAIKFHSSTPARDGIVRSPEGNMVITNNDIWSSMNWVYGTGGGAINGQKNAYIANNRIHQSGYSAITAFGGLSYNNTIYKDGYAHNAQEIGASNMHVLNASVIGMNASWQRESGSTKSGNVWYGAGTALVTNLTLENIYSEDTSWTNMYAGGHMRNVLYKNVTMIDHKGTATYVQGYFYENYGGGQSTSDKNIFMNVYADVTSTSYPITITNPGTNLVNRLDPSLDTRDTITFVNYHLTGSRTGEIRTWFLTYVSNPTFVLSNRWNADVYIINHNDVEDMWIHMPSRVFDGVMHQLYWADIRVVDGNGNPMVNVPVVPVSNAVNPVTGEPIYAMNSNCTTAMKGVVDFITSANPVYTNASGHTPAPDKDIVNTVALTRRMTWRNGESTTNTPVTWNITAFGGDIPDDKIYLDPAGFTDTQTVGSDGMVHHAFGFKKGTLTGITVNQSDYRYIYDLSNISRTFTVTLDEDMPRASTNWEIRPTEDVVKVFGVDENRITVIGSNHSVYLNKTGVNPNMRYNLFRDGKPFTHVMSDNNGKVSYLYEDSWSEHEFQYVANLILGAPGLINRVNKFGLYSYPNGIDFEGKFESKLMGYCS